MWSALHEKKNTLPHSVQLNKSSFPLTISKAAKEMPFGGGKQTRRKAWNRGHGSKRSSGGQVTYDGAGRHVYFTATVVGQRGVRVRRPAARASDGGPLPAAGGEVRPSPRLNRATSRPVWNRRAQPCGKTPEIINVCSGVWHLFGHLFGYGIYLFIWALHTTARINTIQPPSVRK